jgi:hypothetical protein
MESNPSRSSINAYINWVIYAVLGRMGQADDVMNKHRNQIYAVARWMMKQRKPPIRKLYRGVLLEPSEVEDGVIKPDPQLTFLSFSESFDVACWFADPDSIMSGYVSEQRPGVEGWIIEYKPKPSEILWHHTWDTLMGDGQAISLVAAGSQHPHIMMALDQLAWNIHTQREVILKPLKEGADVTAYELANCPKTAELDRRFTQAQFRDNPPAIRRVLIERARTAFAEMQAAKDRRDFDEAMRAYWRAKAAMDKMTDEEARIAREEIEGPIWTGD